jgi:riboflavin synthase
MFTGIIETIGTVKNIKSRGGYKILTISPDVPLEDPVPGESISVDGCCLTLTEYDKSSFMVEASQETVRLTILKNYGIGDPVNLERALQPSGRLGGHFVTGHVDCTGEICDLKKIGDSIEMTVRFLEAYNKLVVEKGSIAINGISLTINQILNDTFTVNLIPFTQAETTIINLNKQDKVNLEFDILGKYAAKFAEKNEKTKITIDKLIESGW